MVRRPPRTKEGSLARTPDQTCIPMADRKRELRPAMDAVGGDVKRLDVRIGDSIEIETRRYEVCPERMEA